VDLTVVITEAELAAQTGATYKAKLSKAFVAKVRALGNTLD
jgi:hypothetical protein